MFFSRRKKDDIGKDSKEQIIVNKEDLECLKQGIKAIGKGEFDFSTCVNEEGPLKEIADALNETAQFYAALFKEIAIDTTEIADLLIDTDYNQLRPTFRMVNIQNEASAQIAANSEEMNASINVTAERASAIAERATETTNFVENGNEEIKNILEDLQKVTSDFDDIVEKMNILDGQMKDIGEVINIITGIADQTNLLSLNAAIEAARAGEHGRGFAVVADEVKKLAEYTKESASKINATIANAQSNTKENVNLINEASKRLNNSSRGSEKAGNLLNQIVKAVQGIDEEVGQIAAVTEEQSAAMNEVTDYVTEVSTAAEEVTRSVEATDNAIYNIGKLINELRNHITGKTVGLSNKEILKLAKADHNLWKWQIANMLKGLESLTIDDVQSSVECRLGKWYHAENNIFKNEPEFAQMDIPHQHVHEYGLKAIEAYNNGSHEQAEKYLEELEKNSNILVQLINTLITKHN